MTGRGRPVIFDEPAQTEFLRLVADGVHIGEAAAKCGVARKTPGQLAARSQAFARQLAAAKTTGREARFAPERLPHGRASTYNNHACRCGPCTTAATHARSNAADRKGAQVLPLPDTQQAAEETEFLMLADVG